MTIAPPVEAPSLEAPPLEPVSVGPPRFDAARPAWPRRFLRGRPQDPGWVRPSLLALLLVTAGLYLWDLSAQGWANAFYSAAVQAGTKSWKAFFFGSFDSSNFITVDKPPASLWVMELSARIFGLNSWSILVPQALEGVAAVGLLFATVRRWFGAGAGLLAGAVLAITPVAALMFRYNNPDALLVLLLVVAAYGTVRALEAGQTKWLVLAGSAIGFGFITKMLQALVVVPAFALVYLLAGPPRLGRRIVQLLWAALALVASAGWWVAAVQLTPAADRPYIGGSQDNSLFNLIFGYNGFGRLTGNEAGSVGGTPSGAGGSMWGPTGWTRLFNDSFGTQASWLIPAALVFLAAVVWLTLRTSRTDRTRAAFLLWGGWLVVTGVVFSFAQGIIHPYYTVALAPAIGALVGMGAVVLWRRRQSWFARGTLAVATALTVWWAFAMLGRTPNWNGWLRLVVLVTGLTAAVGLVLAPLVGRHLRRAAVILAAGAALAGPLAFTIDAVATPQSGALPTAGPTAASAGPGRAFGGFGRAGLFGASGRRAATGTGAFPPGGTGAGFPGAFGGAGAPSATGHAPGRSGAGFGGFGFGGAGRGAAGGLLNASTPDAAVIKALRSDASRYRWVAATVGANSAAGFQLGSGDPIMAIGGFNGTDPAPSLATFKKLVAEGKIHYFIAGGGSLGGGFGGGGGFFGASAGVGRSFGGGGGFTPGRTTAGGSSTTSDGAAITAWVEAHFSAKSVGGVTLYDLAPARG